jgi:hypothetical protein
MSTLRSMPDAQLQQYAAMHKNDPFVFPLAFQESQDRKRARMAQQAQMGGQEPPKVVDQDLQQMAPQPAPMMAPQALPEDQGIGQLPAQNMQKMSGGGITGEPMHFANQGLVQDNGGYFDPNTGAFIVGEPESQLSFLDKVKKGINYNKGLDIDPAAIAAKQKAMANQPQKPAAPAVPFVDPRRMDNAASPYAPLAKTDVPPPPPAPPAMPAAPTAPAPAGFEKQVAGIDKLLPAKETAQAKDTFMAEREAVSKPVWDKFQSTVEKEKSRLSEGKEQDFYMALIEGGLAAAGATGPNGIQNLAQGLSKGAASYGAALKDFRKASQENAKMELDMERAKAAEKRGDMDAYQKYEDSIKNRNADIDKLKTSGIFSLQNVHTAGQYQQQAAATTAAAHIKAAGMPGAQERLIERMGTDPKFAEAYEKFATTGAEAKGLPALAAKIVSTPGGMTALKAENPALYAAINQYLMGMTGAGGIPKPMDMPAGSARP